MSTVVNFAHSSLAHQPKYLHYSMRELSGLSEYARLSLADDMAKSKVFDTSRVQTNIRGEYVIDDAVVLIIRKDLQLDFNQIQHESDETAARSRNEAYSGLAILSLSVIFAVTAILLPEIAIPMYILAALFQLISLYSLVLSGYHAHQAHNLTQVIESPQSHEKWIEEALGDIIAIRDDAFIQGFEYVLRNTPKEMFSRLERSQLHDEYIDQLTIPDFGRISIDDKLEFLL